MPTWKEVVEKYGEEVAEKMKQSGWLDVITCELNDKGEAVIPQRDVDVALKAVTGKKIYEWEWD